MTVIFSGVIFVYVFIKFTDWLNKKQYEKEQKKLDELNEDGRYKEDEGITNHATTQPVFWGFVC